MYELAIKFNILYFESFNGVNIYANKKPINIAVIATATVIREAINSSSPQPLSPNDINSIVKGGKITAF